MTVKTLSEAKEKDPWARAQELGRGVKGAGRDVWLAGLGALHSVDEGGRGLFSDLVARGRRFEAKEKPVLEDRFRKAGERVTAFRARLEHGIEDRLTHTLQRFGVPDRDQVHQLIDRIEELTRKVEGLTGKS